MQYGEKEMNEWFKEGIVAFVCNSDCCFCISPYKSCTVEFYFWKAGWEEALRHSLAAGNHLKQLGCKAKDEM